MRFRVSKEELMKHGLALPTSGGFNVEPDEFTVLEGVPEATTKFNVGDKVQKPKGYSFPATIVAAFTTLKGEERYVAEMEGYGFLHIFNGEQLAPEAKTSGECCEKCICRHAANDYDGPTHCTKPLSGCPCHSVTEVKHIGDDKCYGQPCNHDGTTKCGLPVTAKEGECKQAHDGNHFYGTGIECAYCGFVRPTSTQKEKIEELSYDNGVDMKTIIDKTNEVIRALNRVA